MRYELQVRRGKWGIYWWATVAIVTVSHTEQAVERMKQIADKIPGSYRLKPGQPKEKNDR